MEKFDKPELLLILNTKYSIDSTISIHHPVEKINGTSDNDKSVPNSCCSGTLVNFASF